jgi:hypothetical protein
MPGPAHVGEDLAQGAQALLQNCSEISRRRAPHSVTRTRRAARRANSSSNSAPTNVRLSSLAATAVVPEPQNGSKTKSPSRVEASRARLRSLRGFWVGW